jgi:hypothetical protein
MTVTLTSGSVHCHTAAVLADGGAEGVPGQRSVLAAVRRPARESKPNHAKRATISIRLPAAIWLLSLLFLPNQSRALPIISRLEISPPQPTPADDIALRIDVVFPCAGFSLSPNLHIRRVEQIFVVAAFYDAPRGDACAYIVVEESAFGNLGKLPAGLYQIDATLFERFHPDELLGAPVDHQDTSFTVVPEPASLSLMAIGLATAGVMLRRRRRPGSRFPAGFPHS